MSDMPELKSCPFCGETPEQPVDATRILGVWRIIHRCRVIPPFAIEGPTPEGAIAAWNARADAPLTPAQAMARCREVAELVEAAKCARYEVRIYADLLFRLERALAPFTKGSDGTTS